MTDLHQSSVIILNGVGSVGKTSIAKELQGICSRPFLHLQMDVFLEMMPPKLQNHADGFEFEVISEGGHPAMVIRTGPIGDRVMRGMRRAVAAMADQANNLIVDDVLTDVEHAEYRSLLSRHCVRTVGLRAPLEVLERREILRGDRGIGLARWQFPRIHRGIAYDLELDTSIDPPAVCAERIRSAFGL
jgi:chloramphenicol 3-O phosphotransferase